MSIHKNARLTPLGRERFVKGVLSGQTPEAAARTRRRLPADSAKMGDALQGRRRRRPQGPLVATASAAPADADGHCRAG
jgi:hypothetical protein